MEKFPCMTLILVFFICYYPPLSGAQCAKTPIIFNFGDSNSDTGGFAAAYGNSYSSDRMCDGRLIIDFLCESLKAAYLSPYLECLTSNFTNGVNFAVAGSKTVSKFPLFILSTQVHQFKRFQKSYLKLHSEGNTGVFSETDFAGALYTIDIGQNDLSGPLGCLPNMLANVGKINAPADYDNLGCLIHPNEVASEFNKRLCQLCEEMRSELNDSVIVYVDMYTIKYNIISDYALYGFERPLMACCGGGGAPYNANIGCGQNGSTVCEKGSRYISWDGIHYSESANMIFAAQIASKKFSTPPISFDYFCS
nr:GDSL esterase/lipase At1g09390 [Ipomoea batatas]